MGAGFAVNIDKRGEPRVHDAIGITVHVILDSGYKTLHETSHDITFDISEGGIRFYDEWGLPDDALLEVDLQVGELDRPITLFGRVRWKSPVPDKNGFDVGVQFVEATEADRDAWFDYVGKRRDKTRTGRIYLENRRPDS
jgi:hypothetical protein